MADFLDTIKSLVGGQEVKATSIGALVYALTGTYPIVEKKEKYTEIRFTPEQVKILQATLKSWHDKEAGDVRVDVQPVLLPFYLKRYAWYIAGAVMAGLVIGGLIKR